METVSYSCCDKHVNILTKRTATVPTPHMVTFFRLPYPKHPSLTFFVAVIVPLGNCFWQSSVECDLHSIVVMSYQPQFHVLTLANELTFKPKFSHMLMIS